MTRSLLGIAAAAMALIAGTALADGNVVQPVDWQWGFQPAMSPVAEDIQWFYDWILLPMMVIISAFVLVLMGYILIRFRRSANPQPTRTTHNTLLEVIWTGVPILILVAIAIPSLRLLYFEATIPEAAVTIKATGHQWYWSYEYPDSEGVSFDAIMVDEADLQPDQPRLLTADNEVVLPVGQVIRVQVTSEDVIHAWALPVAGVKTDAVPGRLNELWLEIDEPGLYYGQCSELCGVLHGYMPITVRAVTQDEFDSWIAEKQAALGIVPAVDLAAVQD